MGNWREWDLRNRNNEHQPRYIPMNQAIGDPDDLETFAISLQLFIDQINESTGQLKQQFGALGETWQDANRAQFEEQFQELLRQLVAFEANATEQIPHRSRWIVSGRACAGKISHFLGNMECLTSQIDAPSPSQSSLPSRLCCGWHEQAGGTGASIGHCIAFGGYTKLKAVDQPNRAIFVDHHENSREWFRPFSVENRL